ncbi:MAG: flavodoxin domain-containing protein [Bacteroidota bacterium]
MKTLIAFSSTMGCTEQCAKRLKADLGSDVDLIRISRRRKYHLDQYDTVIIGGSIHEGLIQLAVRRFCQAYLSVLLKKKVGIFVCCMDPGTNEQEMIRRAFPESLIAHSLATGYFGGELNLKKMNLLTQIMTRKAARIEEEIELNGKRIQDFVEKIR